MSNPILQTKTGGYSFLAFLLLAAGIAMILFQILVLAEPPTEGEITGWTRYILGGMGALFIILFFINSRKGWLEVSVEGVRGKTTGGKTYELKLDEIGQVVLVGRGVHFKSPEGKTLVLDKTPHDRQAPGLVWMLKTYPNLKVDQWNTLTGMPKMPPALRLFYDGDKPQFGDRGFIFNFDDGHYFFPDTPTAPLPPEKGKGNNNDLSPYANQKASIPQFEPDPSRLPLEGILRSIEATPEGQRDFLTQFTEAHGGMKLNEIEEGKYEGSLPGWRAEITTRAV